MTSDQPLLSDDEGKAVFGERFVAVQYENGFPAVTDPETPFLPFVRDGGSYVSPTGSPQKMRVSFHTFPDQPDLFIVQLRQEEMDGVNYALAKRVDKRLYITGIGVDEPTLDLVRSKGGTFRGTPSRGVSVSSRADLELMLASYYEVHHTALSTMTIANSYLAIGETDEEIAALVTASAETNCLAVAGHPLDMELANLPPKFRGGLAVEQIDPEVAESVCDYAADLTWDTPRISSRVALLRVEIAAGDYGWAKVIANELMEQGYGLGFVEMAQMARRGQGEAANPALAENYLRKGADKGLPEPQYMLARYIERGWAAGTAQDALDLYLTAEASGLTLAGVAAGRMLIWGSGVAQDQGRGRAKLAAGVEAGLPWAMALQGEMFAQGMGVTQEYRKALNLQLKAAEMRLPQAQYFAALMYSAGQGTQADPVEAARRMKLAMEGGVDLAKVEYGIYLVEGRGVEKDVDQGRQLLEEAAADGNAKAKRYLATLAANETTGAWTLKTVRGEPRAYLESFAADPRGMMTIYAVCMDGEFILSMNNEYDGHRYFDYEDFVPDGGIDITPVVLSLGEPDVRYLFWYRYDETELQSPTPMLRGWDKMTRAEMVLSGRDGFSIFSLDWDARELFRKMLASDQIGLKTWGIPRDTYAAWFKPRAGLNRLAEHLSCF